MIEQPFTCKISMNFDKGKFYFDIFFCIKSLESGIDLEEFFIKLRVTLLVFLF